MPYREPEHNSLPEALGQSEAFLEFQQNLSRVAKVDRPVLIVGERGTGKELASSRLHYLSERWDGPFVALNCSALSPSVLESELFGHESGSFTGANKRRHGRFEAAKGGTLFLDEIGLIPMVIQEKILRVVEYRCFERVGGSESIRVDTRIIGATNADLAQLSKSGRFKRDLLDRLSFEVLFLPPLRYREDDIILLAQHFAARMAQELGRPDIPEFHPDAINLLMEYKWPGNIRELKNVVERAVYRSSSPLIEEIELDPFKCPWDVLLDGRGSALDAQKRGEQPKAMAEVQKEVVATASVESNSYELKKGQSLTDAVHDLELNALKAALEKTQYHQGDAAKVLGLSYHQFRGLYRKYKDEVETKS
jgi:psp operon transcriptional activator